MTKQDLRTGMIITCKNGNEYMIYLGDPTAKTRTNHVSENGIALNLKHEGCVRLDEITDDLKDPQDRDEWVITKVSVLDDLYDLLSVRDADRTVIWEREEEVKELTVSEIEKLLGYSVKIVKE